jgi:glycerol-3-phosphate O-acyltransferase / dihydroxyacetone phosphate acyltransferase
MSEPPGVPRTLANPGLAAPDTMDRFYRTVRRIARFWVWFLFKRVHAHHRERVPAGGPLLLCVNHPNNFIDSILVGAVMPRKVHYLATAALFRNPMLARFLRAAGAIPVYRRQDDPDKMDRNADVFAACYRAFDDGRVVAIYPEGTTHAEARVQRIKTGAARIALGYEAERPGTLKLVPVGLSFEARKSFNARVLVSFGEPLAVTPYLPAYREDPVKAVEALTTAIQWAMEVQVVHVDRIDAAAVVRAVEELYRGELVRELQTERGLAENQIDLVRLSRTIVEAVNHFKAHDPERLENLWQRMQGYRALLARYRVRDEAVRRRLTPPRVRARLWHSWEAIVGLPFFIYGALVNALPYFVPRWLAARMAHKETDYATVRFLASIVAIPVFWGLEIWLVARFFGGTWAALFAVSLPLSGLLAFRYLRGAGRLGQVMRFSTFSLTHGQDARHLIAERQALIADLDHAKDDYLAATRGSSF